MAAEITGQPHFFTELRDGFTSATLGADYFSPYGYGPAHNINGKFGIALVTCYLQVIDIDCAGVLYVNCLGVSRAWYPVGLGK